MMTSGSCPQLFLKRLILTHKGTLRFVLIQVDFQVLTLEIIIGQTGQIVCFYDLNKRKVDILLIEDSEIL